MTPIGYSKHARERMALREITKRQVSAATRKPDVVYDDVTSSALVAVKRTNNRYLVVVYAPLEGGRKRIVTLYSASKVDRLIRMKLESGAWRDRD